MKDRELSGGGVVCLGFVVFAGFVCLFSFLKWGIKNSLRNTQL